jgi:hypothetical protein
MFTVLNLVGLLAMSLGGGINLLVLRRLQEAHCRRIIQGQSCYLPRACLSAACDALARCLLLSESFVPGPSTSASGERIPLRFACRPGHWPSAHSCFCVHKGLVTAGETCLMDLICLTTQRCQFSLEQRVHLMTVQKQGATSGICAQIVVTGCATSWVWRSWRSCKAGTCSYS